jgi:polysaccharide export outer membrane protein
MNTLIKYFAAIFLALGAQSCSTSGNTPATANALPGVETGATTPAPDMGSSGDFVPAVIGIPTDTRSVRAYRIGPHDLLKIEVFQVDDLTTEDRVNEDGLILMPLIGSVKVGGLTRMEAEQTIANRLGDRYLDNPQVSVFISESSRQRVTVSGHVKKPGVFPLSGETTLMQAIAMAGGLDEIAKKEEIVVFRKQEGGDVNAYVVDLAAIEEGKQTDPLMVGDDRVVVPKSGVAVLTRAAGSVLTGWAVRMPWF